MNIKNKIVKKLFLITAVVLSAFGVRAALTEYHFVPITSTFGLGTTIAGGLDEYGVLYLDPSLESYEQPAGYNALFHVNGEDFSVFYPGIGFNLLHDSSSPYDGTPVIGGTLGNYLMRYITFSPGPSPLAPQSWVEFAAPSARYGTGVWIQSVPEPSSSALLIFSLFVSAVAVRRFKPASA